MSTFKVGEVAIIQNARVHRNLNGVECTILRAGAIGFSPLGDYVGYEVDIRHPVTGFFLVARPDQLRKKRPPTTGEESILALFRQNQREGVAA